MTERDAPAFPLTNGEYVYFTGLTKREYFAGQIMGAAIGGLWANPDMGIPDNAVMAQSAVEATDALLTALAKGE